MNTLLLTFLIGWVAGNLVSYFFAVRGVNKKLSRIVERSKPTWETPQAMRRLYRSQAVTLPAITKIESEKK